MKKLFILFLLFYINLTNAQVKQQLIDSIIAENRHDSDCTFYDGSQSPQYKRFQKLSKTISKNELFELSRHDNPIIRTYASIEIIQSLRLNTDVASELFSYSIKNDALITSNVECLTTEQSNITYVIYHSYRDKIVKEALYKAINERTNTELEIKNKLILDPVLKKLDSVILYSEKEVEWMLYARAFENRKYPRRYLPRIEKLAFTKNNPFAFKYLKREHSKEYPELSKN